MAYNGKALQYDTGDVNYQLALDYLNGNIKLGIEQNFEEGINYLSKAANQGSYKAMMKLVDLMIQGKVNIGKNDSIISQLFLLSSEDP